MMVASGWCKGEVDAMDGFPFATTPSRSGRLGLWGHRTYGNRWVEIWKVELFTLIWHKAQTIMKREKRALAIVVAA
jgi:hypothetical protein